MDITGTLGVESSNEIAGAFYKSGSAANVESSWSTRNTTHFQASRSWTGSTNSVAPQTSALGSGSALDVTPAYYTVHMWLRLT